MTMLKSHCHLQHERSWEHTNQHGILPVWLFHEESPVKRILVYALLDNASGGTFVKKSAKTLGVEGSDTNLILTTIHGTSSVREKTIEGLMVASLKEEDI